MTANPLLPSCCCSAFGRRPAAGSPSRAGFPLALMITALLCACKKPEAMVLPPPVVEVMAVAPSEVPLTATLIGQLDSPQNVDVRARVEAFVDEMRFTEGVEVKQGDVLFVLDKKPFLEKLGAAKGSLAEAEAALKKYQTDVNRLQPLADKKAVPQQDLDNSLAAVDAGKANVLTAQSRVETALLNLGYCEVLAPMTGLIGAKQVSIGDLVGKGEPTLLATMSTLDPIWFYCNVSEVSYIKVKEWSAKMNKDLFSLPLTLILADGLEHPDQGSFIFIDRAVDVKTGTLRMRAKFPNPKKILRPGMFARVRVDLGTRQDCLQVPERALVELQGKTFLWVIDTDGKASQRPVKVGEQNGSNFIILEGIKSGERVVVEGLQKVRQDSQVNAMTRAQMAAGKSAPAAEAEPAKK
ncbi:MAG: efflux RND transporter periplasmic adaptor subunit [Verrucomicrobiota bacterium]